MVFDEHGCSTVGPGRLPTAYEAIAEIHEGGVIDRVQGGEQGLEGNGRAEGSRCGVGEEVERDGGIGHVIGFGSLEGALGLSVRGTVSRIEGICKRNTSKNKSGILWCCGVKSCVARRRHVSD